MLVTLGYDRLRAVEYAKTWALSRNPLFMSFSGIGGDCTNFVSQCLYAGSCVMNYTETFGWYYVSASDRAPSWTGVEFFNDFITNNRGLGPYGMEIDADMLSLGDVIQLGMYSKNYYHAMVVTGFEDSVPLICAHSNDALDRRLDSYVYEKIRYIRIRGVRTDLYEMANKNCYDKFIAGERI